MLLSSSTWGNSGITYHGRVLRPNLTPVNSSTTQFRIQIRSPGTENCLLWEETQTKDLSSSNGVFTINIADTNEPSLIPNTLPFSLERIFSNRSQFTALTGCNAGTIYNPDSLDGRVLVVAFRENLTDPWEQMPVTKINFVPIAINSAQLEGYKSTEFLKIDPTSTQSILTPTQVNSLLDLLTGNYLKGTDTANGDLGGTFAAPIVDAIQGISVTTTTPTLNQVLKYNGAAWAPSNDDSGSDKLPLLGGTMTGPLNMGNQNILNINSVAATSVSVRTLVLNDNDTTTVTINTPGNVTSNYSLQLPGDAGAAGEVLSTNGSGVLSWSAPGSGISVTANQAVIANATGNNLINFICPLNQVFSFDGAGLPSCQAVTPAGGFIVGGNSYGAAATLGTNDNFDLNVETNSTIKMTLTTTGNLGLGTVTPQSSLDLSNKTDGINMPKGTTAQRPVCSAGLEGNLRYNSESKSMEFCDGSSWNSIPKSQATVPPTAPSGSGYFVVTLTKFDGNLGGFAGAHDKCLTELSVTNTNWNGYADALARGLLTTTKVKAWLCNGINCNEGMPLTTYYYAAAGNPSAGGAYFTTDANGQGPLDNVAWSAANRFSGSFSIWTDRYNLGGTSARWGSFYNDAHCSNWSSNSTGFNGRIGLSTDSNAGRWDSGANLCNVPNHLVCFVNP